MSIVQNATQILHAACTPFGIVAAQNATDNYTRIWARDAVISGFAGLLAQDEVVIESLQRSIFSLLAAQKQQGQLPSNVSVSATTGQLQTVSYGTMSARIDAICWWIIGATWVANRVDNLLHQQQLYEGVRKAIDLLECWEYNGRGLVYVPMGGNWADEYVTHGYILYDQLLRAKALQLAAKVWQRDDWQEKSVFIYRIITRNYWQPTRHDLPDDYRYRPPEADQKLSLPISPYWWCSLMPTGYDTRFDLFANALALLSPICTAEQAHTVLGYIQTLMAQHGGLIPTFYPIIYPNSPDWSSLEAHYLYRFKNQAGCFHNGGIWAMTTGWIGLAAARWGQKSLAEQLLAGLGRIFDHETNKGVIYEYISSLDYSTGGVPNLSFSAAGILMLLADKTALERVWGD